MFLIQTVQTNLANEIPDTLLTFYLYLYKVEKFMVIERIENNKITITLSSGIDVFGIQRLIDYARYLEATSGSKVKQMDIDKLANEVNESWWANNKHRFAK